jgi:hypothetical protein
MSGRNHPTNLEDSMRRKRTSAGPFMAIVPALIALSTLSAPRASAQPSNAGPWIETRNGYYSSFRLEWVSTSHYYDANGNLQTAVPAQTIKDRSLDLDSEYGISNRLTLHLDMPVEFRAVDVPGFVPDHFSNSGFGDLLFGFKYGFLDPAGRDALALEIDAHTPTGYNSNGFGFPPLGYGKFSADAHLHAGLTLDPTPAYVQAEVGYRKFTDNTVSDALTYSAEAGVFATPRVLVMASLGAQKARDDTKFAFLSYTAVQGLVQYRLKPHVDVLAGYTATLGGKNVFKDNGLILGVSLRGNRVGRYRGQAAGSEEAVAPAAALPKPAAAPAAIPAAPAPVATPAPVPAPGGAPADTSQAPAQPK